VWNLSGRSRKRAKNFLVVVVVAAAGTKCECTCKQIKQQKAVGFCYSNESTLSGAHTYASSHLVRYNKQLACPVLLWQASQAQHFSFTQHISALAG